MDESIGSLTVFFEDPFWVGVFQRTTQEGLCACRVVFGGEPTDRQVYAFVLENYYRLAFSQPVEGPADRMAENPKRRQRQAQRQQRQAGAGTRSQQALKLQQEARKQEREQTGKAAREAERRRRFDQKQEKRKQKHRGR